MKTATWIHSRKHRRLRDHCGADDAVIVAGVVAVAFFAVAALGCGKTPEPVLGTLEWDRISLPTPAFERIVEIHVREGDRVEPGDVLVSLETERGDLRLIAARADVTRLEKLLAEARAGARIETRQQANALLRAAESQAEGARLDLQRIESLVQQEVSPQAELDHARTVEQRARAEAAAARAALDELRAGTRDEEIAQAEAALAAARAYADIVAVDQTRITVVAPRAGRVESLPFEVGDQPPIGATVAVLLVGERPFARVYLPQTRRAQVAIGDSARVFIDGWQEPFAARVRRIRNEPAFTPYYALSGEDAARLSYLTEIELEPNDADLPVGVPVRVELATKEPR